MQLISSILLLKSQQLEVLQASLLGSILSNLLLMTGLGFFCGGCNRQEQYFNAAVAQTISMLLLLALISLVIPTASHLLTNANAKDILIQSRGTSIVILISYGLWLLFQLKTNVKIFDEPQAPALKAKVRLREPLEGAAKTKLAEIGGALTVWGIEAEKVSGSRDNDGSSSSHTLLTPKLALPVAILTMAISSTLIAFNAQFATDSIQNLLTVAGLSPTFVGAILLPVISCDPTSIMNARKDQMNVSIALTLERCMQTSLMVVPLVILLAWTMDIPLTLQFDSFLVISLFVSINIVTYVVQEGKSNW